MWLFVPFIVFLICSVFLPVSVPSVLSFLKLLLLSVFTRLNSIRYLVIFQDPMVTSVKMAVFWNNAPRGLLHTEGRFRVYCLHHQGWCWGQETFLKRRSVSDYTAQCPIFTALFYSCSSRPFILSGPWSVEAPNWKWGRNTYKNCSLYAVFRS